MSKPKNIVTLKLTATQFVELMRLFDWKFQFANVDHDSTKRLWATLTRQTGAIPVPAYDLGETDPKPVIPEPPKKHKKWWF